MSDTSTPILEITDPQQAPVYRNTWLSRAITSRLKEPRDEVFARLTLRMILVMTSAMALLFWAIHFTRVAPWIPALIYLALWGLLVPSVILMLHNTMHRSFFRDARWNRWHPYPMSFFFGIPSAYREHHLGMHHVEDNMQEDLSSTMRYQRDSFLHFLHYFGRFFLLVVFELPAYLFRKHRNAMAQRVIVFEIAHELIIVGALIVDWRFGLVAFVIPFVMCRFMMMAGNWGQHAFINVAHQNNGIANSITCINTPYNHRCFNDGYHIGHHLKANRHWTELPADFIANREQYAREGAIVFRGLDFFLVSVLLWTGQWKILARRYVRLDGLPRTDDEVIAMLKERVQPVQAWPLEAIGIAA